MTRRKCNICVWSRRVAVFIVALPGLVLGGGYLALRTSLPETSGTIAVAGLDDKVEVLRDANGVPYVFAASSNDAYFALGFVHAQDRLWQMEIQRRLAAGRLSEILGAATLDTDRFFRTLGMDRVAARNVAALDADARATLAAYAAGVNAFLDQRRGLLPPEFVILGAPEPEPWRPADSLTVLKLMAWRLSRNWRDEVLRARLSRRLSREQIAELWPSYSGEETAGLPDRKRLGLYQRLPLDALWERAPPGAPRSVGSNNWAVAGGRSETGKPLLANDVHLRLSAPGPFYLAHLNAPGLDVVGATLPGLPVVVLGHNDRIAWGLTNTAPDTQDLFIERGDPDRPGSYLAPGGPRRFTTRDEIIRVDGGADVTLTVRNSRHGPIVSDLLPALGAELGEGEAIAFAWTALGDEDPSVRAGLEVARARDWSGFVAAVRDFHSPQQNIVYADVDGNIGFYAPARVPIRKSGDGRTPVAGWSGAYDWVGFVPFEELPHAFNPASGRIVTANNKVVPDGYPYLITHDWAPPYRARRIAELIDRRPRHSLASFRDIQSDTVSPLARELVPHLLNSSPNTEAGRTARALIEGWDGEMARERPEPLVFAAWYRELTRLVYADELGPMFDDARGFRPLFMRWVLDGGGQRWCDDIATAAVETCAERAARALDAAAAHLVARYGAEQGDWRWGEAHYADHAHGAFAGRPLLGKIFGIRLPNGGGRFTINSAGYSLGNSERLFVQTHGPALRAIYDLADLDRSLFIHTTGQSGNLLSPHYRDLAERWRDHRPFSIPTRRDAIETEARLVLVPR